MSHEADADLLALADSLQALLERHGAGPLASSDAPPGNAHRDLWPLICESLGLGELALATDVPTRTRLLARCFEIAGARLVQLPMLSTLGMAVPAARAALAGTEPWLADLAAGHRTATVAVPSCTDVSVGPDVNGGLAVTGDLGLVLDGATSDNVLFVADLPDEGSSLLRVAGDAPGMERRHVSPFDTTREIGSLAATSARCSVVGVPGAGPKVVRALATQSAALLAADTLGGSKACLDLATAHARTRHQFGRSVGSFQVIKHRLSDMFIDLEISRAAVRHACERIDDDASDAELWGGIAHLVASENFTRTAKRSIQVHGGIGFTWEHPIHLYLKRAKATETLLGPRPSTARIAGLLSL